MGRNLRERKEVLEEQRKKQLERRRFLKRFGIGLGTAALASIGGQILFSRNREDGRWAFMEKEININVPYGGWKYVEDHYVSLRPEIEFNSDDPEFQGLVDIKKPAMQQECRRREWKKVAILGTEQHYGRPEEACFTESYKEYLEKGIEYVYSTLPWLERLPLELVVLRQGQDFSKVKTGRGFIGYSLHALQRIHVENESTKEKFVVGLSKNRSGSATVLNYDRISDKINSYCIFFGTGNDALLAPISETLHLSLTKYTQKHFDRLGGFRECQTAEESLVEGVSNIIGTNFIQEMGVPKWEEKLEKIQQGMKKEPRYKFVPQSIAWLRQNGIDRGLELYMANPEEYLKAIAKHS